MSGEEEMDSSGFEDEKTKKLNNLNGELFNRIIYDEVNVQYDNSLCESAGKITIREPMEYHMNKYLSEKYVNQKSKFDEENDFGYMDSQRLSTLRSLQSFERKSEWREYLLNSEIGDLREEEKEINDRIKEIENQKEEDNSYVEKRVNQKKPEFTPQEFHARVVNHRFYSPHIQDPLEKRHYGNIKNEERDDVMDGLSTFTEDYSKGYPDSDISHSLENNIINNFSNEPESILNGVNHLIDIEKKRREFENLKQRIQPPPPPNIPQQKRRRRGRKRKRVLSKEEDVSTTTTTTTTTQSNRGRRKRRRIGNTDCNNDNVIASVTEEKLQQQVTPGPSSRKTVPAHPSRRKKKPDLPPLEVDNLPPKESLILTPSFQEVNVLFPNSTTKQSTKAKSTTRKRRRIRTRSTSKLYNNDDESNDEDDNLLVPSPPRPKILQVNDDEVDYSKMTKAELEQKYEDMYGIESFNKSHIKKERKERKTAFKIMRKMENRKKKKKKKDNPKIRSVMKKSYIPLEIPHSYTDTGNYAVMTQKYAAYKEKLEKEGKIDPKTRIAKLEEELLNPTYDYSFNIGDDEDSSGDDNKKRRKRRGGGESDEEFVIDETDTYRDREDERIFMSGRIIDCSSNIYDRPFGKPYRGKGGVVLRRRRRNAKKKMNNRRRRKKKKKPQFPSNTKKKKKKTKKKKRTRNRRVKKQPWETQDFVKKRQIRDWRDTFVPTYKANRFRTPKVKYDGNGLPLQPVKFTCYIDKTKRVI